MIWNKLKPRDELRVILSTRAPAAVWLYAAWWILFAGYARPIQLMRRGRGHPALHNSHGPPNHGRKPTARTITRWLYRGRATYG